VATSRSTQRSKSRPAQASGPSAGRPSRRSSSRAGGRRSGAQSRRVGLASGWIQRRPPEKSGVQKLLGGVSSALPAVGKGRTKAPASSGKAKRGGAVGGLALLAAAAGVAFKNRDKITSKLSGDQSNGSRGSAASGTTGSSATGAGVADVPGPPLGGTSARNTERSRTAGGPRDSPSDAGPLA
jgi:hypothetical protein